MTKNKQADFSTRYRLCEKMLFRYPLIKEAVLRAKEEQATFLKGNSGGGGGAKGTGDPTSSIAMRRTEPIDSVVITIGKYHKETIYKAEKWLWVMFNLLQGYEQGSKLLNVYKAKFTDNRNDMDIVNQCVVGSLKELADVKRKIIFDLMDMADKYGIFK